MPTVTTDPWPEPSPAIPAVDAAEEAIFAEMREALSLIVGANCPHDWRRLPLTEFSLYICCETCHRVVDLGSWVVDLGSWDRTPQALASQRFWRSLPPLTGPVPDPYGTSS